MKNIFTNKLQGLSVGDLIGLKLLLLLLFLFTFIYPAIISAKLKIRGTMRNDAIATSRNNEFAFGNILENKLIIEKKSKDWRFYNDGRLYLFYPPFGKEDKEYEPLLMRSFIRYFSDAGDITVGKTYVNFGNMGVFNPFEIDKTVNLTDLSYDKSGILALEWDLPIGEISGLKVYAGTRNQEDPISGENMNPVMAGGSLSFNVKGFDFGFVGNHKGEDINISGLYFKGDLIIGVQGSYAYHFNDQSKVSYNEASFGIDYSFFSGHLILNALFYYNQKGAHSLDDYGEPNPHVDKYFLAKSYIFGNIQYIFDEFLNVNLSSFMNMVDESSLIIFSINSIIANGLAISLQGAVLSGKDNEEFSKDTLAQYSILARVEAKF